MQLFKSLYHSFVHVVELISPSMAASLPKLESDCEKPQEIVIVHKEVKGSEDTLEVQKDPKE